uniref:Uncharacterized protein n=1 Tax=Leersia perrieri TaxID=77586 RepID=A0A0D9VPQ7_9ORYZ
MLYVVLQKDICYSLTDLHALINLELQALRDLRLCLKTHAYREVTVLGERPVTAEINIARLGAIRM